MPYRFTVLQAGSTLSHIAKEFYDDSAKYPLILNRWGNPIAEPDHVQAGELLTLPMLDQYFTYPVESGDILSGLAARFLGKAGLYRLILDEHGNQLPSPDNIQVGQTLRIPRNAWMPPSGLTPHAVANATYSSEIGGTVKLTDGSHSGLAGDLPGMRYTHIDQVTFGTLLNNSEHIDAAVLLSTNVQNTTGRFFSLGALVNLYDDLVEASAITLDDRIIMESFAVEDKLIKLAYRAPYSGDNSVITKDYKLFGDGGFVGVVEAGVAI